MLDPGGGNSENLGMRICHRFVIALTFALSGTLLVTSAWAEDKGAPPDQAEMMAKMVALGQPSENHKLLADLVGSWDCKITFWMEPGAPPSVSLGTAVRKSIMDGRYFVLDTAAKMEMPGPDGQMHPVDFKGMELDGYDNVKGKFFSTWVDNTGTSLLMAEGSYDPASKTFTYHLEEEMAPGVKTKVRETLRVIDKDHHVFEWHEDRGGKEEKTMEVTYTRQGVITYIRFRLVSKAKLSCHSLKRRRPPEICSRTRAPSG